MTTTHSLFPEIQPNQSGHLDVGDGHTLYWEECGNPHGVPVLFLHGGPGAGLSPIHRRFFDPDYYRIVLFDQRGAGQSRPLGEFRHNTTAHLLRDIEKLRAMFNIDQWLLFGGSWGSTLALAYGEAYPSACLGFVLRGIFLCTKAEIDWFINGIRHFFPEVYADFAAAIPQDERHDLLNAYANRLFSDDPTQYMPAVRSWANYEGRCLYLLPEPGQATELEKDDVSLGLSRLEAHYMLYGGFLGDDQLIKNVDKIRHLPAVIIQGRYDVICPPISAHRLHQAWPESVLHIIPNAGHAALEPGITAALVAATEQFKLKRGFGDSTLK